MNVNYTSNVKEITTQAVVPQWYTTISDIPEDLNSYYAHDTCFCILEDINVTELISLLSCGNREALLKKDLYRLFDHKKTEVIEELIRSGKKLIPPTISYHAESCSLHVHDGRHRLRSALIAEQLSIPILISKNNFEPIFKLLKFDQR
jgi:hypothetical protein